MKLDLGYYLPKQAIGPSSSSATERWRRLLITRLIGVGLVLVLLCAVAAPALISATYLAAGRQSLADADGAERAVVSLDRARRWSPDDPTIYRALAQAYLQLDQPREAIDALEQAHRLQPGSLLIQQELAQAYIAGGAAERARLIWARAGVNSQYLLMLSTQAGRAGHYEEALDWYRQAALLMEEPLDTFPNVLDNQMFVMESYTSQSVWKPCSWCLTAPDSQFKIHQGTLEMSYSNIADRRDGFAVLSTPDISIDQFSHLLLRLKGDPGTLVTIELMVDNQRSRPFNYQPALGEWEVWTIPITGKTLNEIVIAIAELEPMPTPERAHLLVDWIVLK